MKNKIIQGNALEILGTLPAESVNCCVTSPPYWQLRDYDIEPTFWPGISFFPMSGLPEISIPEIECCYGLESDILSYIGHTVQVFREVGRVLKNDGTLWLNIGDTYCTSGGITDSGDNGIGKKYKNKGRKRNRIKTNGIKTKDMYGLPWRIAFALQAAGWYLRQDVIEKQIWLCPDCGHEMIIDRINDNDIIWSKPCPTPESMMIDRCTKAHEYIFLFSKSRKYYFDSLAIAEEYKDKTKTVWYTNKSDMKYKINDKNVKGKKIHDYKKIRKPGKYNKAPKKSVWTIAGANFSEAHFATFPEKLIIPCIQAGCPPEGIVLDPFGGAGTTALVARKLNRNYLLIEIKPEYTQMAKDRLRKEIPLFA